MDENIAWDICLLSRAVEKDSAVVEITLNEEEREACVRAVDRWKEMKAGLDMRNYEPKDRYFMESSERSRCAKVRIEGFYRRLRIEVDQIGRAHV